MNKCFEGINRVTFDDKNEVIMGMTSVEGESVELANPVNVVEGDKKGNVEKWLLEMQESMISCLTQITADSIIAYSTKKARGVGSRMAGTSHHCGRQHLLDEGCCRSDRGRQARRLPQDLCSTARQPCQLGAGGPHKAWPTDAFCSGDNRCAQQRRG